MATPPGKSGGSKPGGTKNISGRGQRDLKVKVKTAKGRKLSSTRWLERQLNDPYVARARREGMRGRAAFKLIELDDKFRFLVPGARVVDLGCAPGGWLQVAVERVNAMGEKKGKRRGTVLCSHAPIIPEIVTAVVHAANGLESERTHRASMLHTAEFTVLHVSAGDTPALVALETHAPAEP